MATRMEQLHALLSTLRVEDFAVASPALVARLRAGLKKSFDLAAATPGAAAPPPLHELFLEGFDAEQLWAQLNMQHIALLGLLGVHNAGTVRALPSWLLLGIGGWLVFMGKPTSALALALLAAC